MEILSRVITLIEEAVKPIPTNHRYKYECVSPRSGKSILLSILRGVKISVDRFRVRNEA